MAGAGDELVVKMEIVTPMFLGGAVPKGTPELRPASVRGALRFWWRAWHQACEPSPSVLELFRGEASVFGSTESASPLTVRLSGQPVSVEMERTEVPSGLNYLLYGMHSRPSGAHAPVSLRYRPALAPGQQFGLVLAARPRRGAEQTLPRGALAALWLLCNLGGLGARTRRGAGGLHALSSQGHWPEDMPPLDLAAGSPADLCDRLADALRRLVTPTSEATPPPLGIPILDPKHTVIVVIDKKEPWATWESALEEVGESFRSFRSRYRLSQPGSDYHAVKSFIQGGPLPATVKRAAFGLPLQFQYRSLPGPPSGRKAFVSGVGPAGASVDRSASRLHFRVVPLANGQLAVVLLVFLSPLLPAHYRLELKSAAQNGTADPPDTKIIREYLDYAWKYVGRLLEVRYG